MTEIVLIRDQYIELEKLGLGAFSPLTGFMNETEFRSVVERMRLPAGDPFTLPVVLDVDSKTAAALRCRPRATLIYEGDEVGHLIPEDQFTCDRPAVARAVYGTDDRSHPGVAHLFRQKEIFVGGPVRLLRRAQLDISEHELTPAQTRAIFAERGWNTIAGFQTRNVPHRAHEYLQRVALEHVDGLFIQPLVGHKRAGDYTPQAIMSGYRALVGQFLPTHNVVLGVLSTSMRYAGPREAVFHAIIRRNYGFTHFIVGRDHAGVGQWYGRYDAHALTRQFEGELGITILRLHGPYHCRVCDAIVTERTCPHGGTVAAREISGTDMRRILVGGATPDKALMRPEIVNALRDIPLFLEYTE